MRSYQSARSLFSFLEGCSKLIIGLGVLSFFGAFYLSAETNAGVVAAIALCAIGIVLGLGGLYGLAMVQMARAGVD
ncbi:hypothetical protein ACS3SW_07575 [Roseobacteraceae bacterium S113]